MTTDVTKPVRMVFTHPIHFYTYLDLKREVKNIKDYQQLGFAKIKTINTSIIEIF